MADIYSEQVKSAGIGGTTIPPTAPNGSPVNSSWSGPQAGYMSSQGPVKPYTGPTLTASGQPYNVAEQANWAGASDIQKNWAYNSHLPQEEQVQRYMANYSNPGQPAAPSVAPTGASYAAAYGASQYGASPQAPAAPKPPQPTGYSAAYGSQYGVPPQASQPQPQAAPRPARPFTSLRKGFIPQSNGGMDMSGAGSGSFSLGGGR